MKKTDDDNVFLSSFKYETPYLTGLKERFPNYSLIVKQKIKELFVKIGYCLGPDRVANYTYYDLNLLFIERLKQLQNDFFHTFEYKIPLAQLLGRFKKSIHEPFTYTPGQPITDDDIFRFFENDFLGRLEVEADERDEIRRELFRKKYGHLSLGLGDRKRKYENVDDEVVLFQNGSEPPFASVEQSVEKFFGIGKVDPKLLKYFKGLQTIFFSYPDQVRNQIKFLIAQIEWNQHGSSVKNAISIFRERLKTYYDFYTQKFQIPPTSVESTLTKFAVCSNPPLFNLPSHRQFDNFTKLEIYLFFENDFLGNLKFIHPDKQAIDEKVEKQPKDAIRGESIGQGQILFDERPFEEQLYEQVYSEDKESRNIGDTIVSGQHKKDRGCQGIYFFGIHIPFKAGSGNELAEYLDGLQKRFPNYPEDVRNNFMNFVKDVECSEQQPYDVYFGLFRQRLNEYKRLYLQKTNQKNVKLSLIPFIITNHPQKSQMAPPFIPKRTHCISAYKKVEVYTFFENHFLGNFKIDDEFEKTPPTQLGIEELEPLFQIQQDILEERSFEEGDEDEDGAYLDDEDEEEKTCKQFNRQVTNCKKFLDISGVKIPLLRKPDMEFSIYLKGLKERFPKYPSHVQEKIKHLLNDVECSKEKPAVVARRIFHKTIKQFKVEYQQKYGEAIEFFRVPIRLSDHDYVSPDTLEGTPTFVGRKDVKKLDLYKKVDIYVFFENHFLGNMKFI